MWFIINTPFRRRLLEAIYLIGLENEAVRVKDVAQAMGVTMPSVVAAIKSLSGKGLVEQEQYGSIELTNAGNKVAQDVYKRHQTLYDLFSEVLGLEPEVAERDACQVEHYLSPETGRRLSKMVEYIRSCPIGDKQAIFLERFRQYVKTGQKPEPCCGCPMNEAQEGL